MFFSHCGKKLRTELGCKKEIAEHTIKFSGCHTTIGMDELKERSEFICSADKEGSESTSTNTTEKTDPGLAISSR